MLDICQAEESGCFGALSPDYHNSIQVAESVQLRRSSKRSNSMTEKSLYTVAVHSPWGHTLPYCYANS